jgi:peptidoglycan/xylan/chitin deacetylase (PgdA/CDA1 family)
MNRAITRILGRGVFAAQLDTLLLRDSAVVVAFHRVLDMPDSDSLTVDVRMFERFCTFFKSHFRVVALRDLVHKLESGVGLNRELAITFDDGYRDNFENAAPVLERLSLPATFFVVSQWIGTDVVSWWDSQQGARYPWMTWDEVRSLHRRGFDIGAHTRTHADLGAVSEIDAQEEIFGARCELETQLAAPVELFAYPYGRRHNLANPNRDLVRAAGFRCCCSCFGGTVTSGSDPFHLTRVPISTWYASPHQFGLEVALGRSVLSA